MTDYRENLEKLRQIKRKAHHPLIHQIHKEHKISKKTLFYVKEYGPHSHVAKTIIKESLKILLLASIISSLGGLALENVKLAFVSIIPLIILFPAMNDMIGDYGMIISSKFSTMLHEGKVKGKWWKILDLKKLFWQVILISIIMAAFSSAVALIFSIFSGFALNAEIVSKIFLVVILDVLLLVSILFLVSVYAGLYFFKKQEDPNNFLIPITTSIADFGNMIVLSLLIVLFF